MTLNLQDFCDEDRPKTLIHEPFSDDNYSYATDGTICIRVPRRPEITATGQAKMVAGWFADASGQALSPLPPLDLPEARVITESCMECHGVGHFRQCTKCNAMGFIECGECGHESDCEECNGEGLYIVPVTDGVPELSKDDPKAEMCELCDGSGRTAPTIVSRPVEVAPDLYFSQILLHRIMVLPGLQVALGRAAQYATPRYFRFDGGDGLIMPMHASASDPIVIKPTKVPA